MNWLDVFSWFGGPLSIIVSFVSFLTPWVYSSLSPQDPHHGPWRHCDAEYNCFYKGVLFPLPEQALGESVSVTQALTLLSFLLTAGMLIALGVDGYFRWRERKSLAFVVVATLTGLLAALLTISAMAVWASKVNSRSYAIGWAFWLLPINSVAQLLSGVCCALQWRKRKLALWPQRSALVFPEVISTESLPLPD